MSSSQRLGLRSRASSFRVRVTLRLRTSWTSWVVARRRRRLARETRLLQVLTLQQVLQQELVAKLEQELHPPLVVAPLPAESLPPEILQVVEPRPEATVHLLTPGQPEPSPLPEPEEKPQEQVVQEIQDLLATSTLQPSAPSSES